MHPLIPENIEYRSMNNPKLVSKEIPIQNVVFRKAVGQIKAANAKEGSALDWMFSFGTSHPGGLVLHNYPTFMSDFVAERAGEPAASKRPIWICPGVSVPCFDA